MTSSVGIASDPQALNNAGTWPGPRTSHYYFDLNRDWFTQSHPESKGRVKTFLQWMPQVAIDLHEQGSSATFYFAPPREPDNRNNPKHLPKWFDIFAAAHGAAFDTHGWSYFRREGYDSFYPGYGEGWPMLTGSIGMLFESASSAGGAVLRNDGTLRTLKQAAWEHYTAEWTTVRTSARRRTELLRDYAQSRSDAITSHAKEVTRGVVFARDAQGRADSLVMELRANGIDVGRLGADADLANATAYGSSAPALVTKVRAGSYVVDYAQPQGHLAKALLEPDAELDSAFLKFELELRRTGSRNRFYDVTAWSLPMAWRLQAWAVRAIPAGVTAVTELTRAAATAMPAAQYGYAFAPGSEASIRLLASLLRDSIRVWHAPMPFTSGGVKFARGAFVVRVAANRADVHGRVAALAQAAGAQVTAIASAGVSEGTDLGSNSVVPIRAPRVAMLGGAPVSGTPFGFIWYAMDQRLGYPSTVIDAAYIGSGDLSRYSVLIVPSVQAGALDRLIGDGGKARIADWVRAGGVLITTEAATQWARAAELPAAHARAPRLDARRFHWRCAAARRPARRAGARHDRHPLAAAGRRDRARDPGVREWRSRVHRAEGPVCRRGRDPLRAGGARASVGVLLAGVGGQAGTLAVSLDRASRPRSRDRVCARSGVSRHVPGAAADLCQRCVARIDVLAPAGILNGVNAKARRTQRRPCAMRRSLSREASEMRGTAVAVAVPHAFSMPRAPQTCAISADLFVSFAPFATLR